METHTTGMFKSLCRILKMSDTKQIYIDIIRIISETTRVPKEDLSLDTSVNIDLRIEGDDWDELMYPIVDKYPIEDFSEFEFSRHMRPEGDLILPFLLELVLSIPRVLTGSIIFLFNKRIGRIFFKKRFFGILKYEEKPLYIADIYNSVLKNKWNYAKNSNLNLKQLIL